MSAGALDGEGDDGVDPDARIRGDGGGRDAATAAFVRGVLIHTRDVVVRGTGRTNGRGVGRRRPVGAGWRSRGKERARPRRKQRGILQFLYEKSGEILAS